MGAKAVLWLTEKLKDCYRHGEKKCSLIFPYICCCPWQNYKSVCWKPLHSCCLYHIALLFHTNALLILL